MRDDGVGTFDRRDQIEGGGIARSNREALHPVHHVGRIAAEINAIPDAGDRMKRRELVGAGIDEVDPHALARLGLQPAGRSEEHTSELQSRMRSSYDVFCLKKKTKAN